MYLLDVYVVMSYILQGQEPQKMAALEDAEMAEPQKMATQEVFFFNNKCVCVCMCGRYV